MGHLVHFKLLERRAYQFLPRNGNTLIALKSKIYFLLCCVFKVGLFGKAVFLAKPFSGGLTDQDRFENESVKIGYISSVFTIPSAQMVKSGMQSLE